MQGEALAALASVTGLPEKEVQVRAISSAHTPCTHPVHGRTDTGPQRN